MVDEKVEKLKKQLIDSKINIDNWGVGCAKTVEHLQREFESGEAFLINDKNGNLLRKVVAVGADIYYTSPSNKKYHLREDRQIFKDGRERKRNNSMSVCEKIRPNESPRDAVIRGIREELGISGEITLLPIENKIIRRVSNSYPGLQSEYICYNYKIILKKEQFNPKGYVENQSDKDTYFIWDEINNKDILENFSL